MRQAPRGGDANVLPNNLPFKCSLGGDLKSGYGNQTALCVPRIRDLGYDVALSAFYGLHGSPLEWNGIKTYPGGYHPYGMDIIMGHAADHFGGSVDDGLIITLIDAWVLDAALLTRANVAAWAPVDHEPAPPHIIDFFTASQATPLAMSRSGEQAFRDAGLEPLYVPHCVDTNLFEPRDKADAKREMGLSADCFLVGIVAANKGYPSRKGFAQMLEAFARFQRSHPKAMLYLHTEINGAIQGVSIPAICEANDIPAEAIIQCDQYRYLLGLPPEHMVNAYNAMDVLLNTSYGEGFGIPVIEAQSCGTPVIVTDWTAMREVGAVGWRVGGQRQFTDQRAFQMIPNVEQIETALEEAFTDAHDLRDAAREHALEYDADLVTERYWKPVLEQLSQGIGPEPVSVVEIGPTAELAEAAA